ncbi:MAG TPA: radical SAM protein [Streptosporangiaceae bacterium]|nr:radical SAM protein [Streptosporangiaceae bacterium]
MSAGYERALESLHAVDPGYPVPEVIEVLAVPGNRHLLEYVVEDPFGAHVFPGNLPGHPPDEFLVDLNNQLTDCRPIHLWCYIPTCGYRCRFCQYSVVLTTGGRGVAGRKASEWAELNMQEAELWLAQVPSLKSVPVGEFNVFGGTPSLLPPESVAKLLGFYRQRFNFTPQTTIRFEGDPTTLTRELLQSLVEAGCTKVSCGVQSFSDQVLQQCGRPHTSDSCRAFIRNARDAGFDWISIDLMFGLLDQTVSSVEQDLRHAVEAEVTAVVCAKLHLRSYTDTRTGVAGEKPAAWQIPAYRDRLAQEGHHWPTLGEQYQMHEVLTQGLVGQGYAEHPAMYFARREKDPEKWKSIMVDQDKQEAEVAIGLGGSSSCRAAEAITTVNPTTYQRSVTSGVIPLDSATRFDAVSREARAVKMALSSCQPLSDELHQQRFPGRSLFASPWYGTFQSLAARHLVNLDPVNGQIALTGAGSTLVEAIINTEF